jgi:hypothetical protein
VAVLVQAAGQGCPGRACGGGVGGCASGRRGDMAAEADGVRAKEGGVGGGEHEVAALEGVAARAGGCELARHAAEEHEVEEGEGLRRADAAEGGEGDGVREMVVPDSMAAMASREKELAMSKAGRACRRSEGMVADGEAEW